MTAGATRAGPAEDVSQCRAARPARVAPAVMVGLDRLDAESAELDALARPDLPHVRERFQQARTSAGNDNRQLAGERFQRRNVEMVVVQVRKQHPARSLRDGGGAVAAQVKDPATQDRIGDDPLAVQVDDDSRVTQPGHCRAHLPIVAA